MCQPGRPGPQGESQLVSSSVLVRLPQREVERALLQRGGARLLALVHVLGAPVRELPVPLEAPHPEVDVPAGLIGVPRLDQIGDQPDDPADRLGGQGLGIRPPQPKPIGVLEVGARHPRRKLRRGLPRLPRRRVDLVVDVGDVDDQLRPVALRPQKPGEQGEDDEGPRIADVDPAVHGRPARIDPDLTPGIERPQLPTQRVLDLEPRAWRGLEPRRFCSRTVGACGRSRCEPRREPSRRRRRGPRAWPRLALALISSSAARRARSSRLSACSRIRSDSARS